MRAARRFAETLEREGHFSAVARVAVDLYGSLAHTGKGHGTDVAVQLGLAGETPEEVDVDAVPAQIAAIASAGTIALLGRREVDFRVGEHVIFLRRKSLPLHPNGMRFVATDASGAV